MGKLGCGGIWEVYGGVEGEEGKKKRLSENKQNEYSGIWEEGKGEREREREKNKKFLKKKVLKWEMGASLPYTTK